ncbi:hypothetical protein JOC34_003537 [Virgibacillus halotolerans]|nr:hypothetical protein [Virgibacillus halotolerans]MBM7601116.1 hypothetical protein [Virgibacillus halotolerans]
MKKTIVSIALGALLVVGFSFAQSNQPTDSAMEVEPSVLSIQTPVANF